MEFPAVRWRMPPYGVVKINVHGFFSEEVFPNGNRTGIGVVIRNHRGRILRLYEGSLGIVERRLNELYAMLQGLVRAFLDDYKVIELETDNVEAFWEWSDSMINGVPQEHEFVVRQLNTKKADENYDLMLRIVDENANSLARYVARYGATHFDRMVIFSNLFGRVCEIWHHDIGLGPVGVQFVPILEVDLEDEIVNDEVIVDEELLEVGNE
ncbi:hypothetical protein AgCh_001781 [Apium graveolens]